MAMDQFRKELIELINKHSEENASDTPDFLLGDYLLMSLDAFNAITRRRTHWYTLPESKRPCVTAMPRADDEFSEDIGHAPEAK